MGPRGLVASYLYRPAASPARQADPLSWPGRGRRSRSPARKQRGRDPRRPPGAGPGHDLVFADRVIATLVILRFQLAAPALALFYGVDRSTVTRAVHEVRPLLARRGFAVPGHSGLRLRTLADVFAYAAAEGVRLAIDGTEVQVRRPRANRPGRRAYVSGKKKQNTIKPTAISDADGRLLWLGAIRPGRMPRHHRHAHRGHREPAPPPSRRHRRGPLRLPGSGP